MSKNQVAIIYSPGFGAGWSSWGDPKQALDKELAMAIYENEPDQHIKSIASKNWPDAYQGGLLDCEVVWVDEGTMFRITEYDGSESIMFKEDDEQWQVAI